MKRKQQQLALLDRRVYGDSEHATGLTLDKEGVDNVVFRMYQQGVKDHDERRSRIRRQYLNKYKIEPKRYEGKQHEVAVLDRLYNTKEKDLSRSKELFERWNPQRKFLKRTKEELHANDERLNAGGFAKKH